jgi:hypothetical protein
MLVAVQSSATNFYAELSRDINEDLDLNTVINKILIKAIKLIDCERSSLFLVDHERKELYARAFDLKADSKDSNQTSQEIRFPMGQGVAGIVAESGDTLNIPDAYADLRFNKVIILHRSCCFADKSFVGFTLWRTMHFSLDTNLHPSLLYFRKLTFKPASLRGKMADSVFAAKRDFRDLTLCGGHEMLRSGFSDEAFFYDW